ncbi:hypothetical protein PGT21_005387 [Puccinia graminis f. sp. tritici]|uniref:Uncharacterized protein n=1 Tax=Puccinia graminis f. sp. tritici TaxID=56615 RepID=A0A5B0LSV9_PUCGR|nr:hypothetical protein PGT21_005387 [Puccinia graminis f. sp. tritici]
MIFGFLGKQSLVCGLGVLGRSGSSLGSSVKLERRLCCVSKEHSKSLISGTVQCNLPTKFTQGPVPLIRQTGSPSREGLCACILTRNICRFCSSAHGSPVALR